MRCLIFFPKVTESLVDNLFVNQQVGLLVLYLRWRTNFPDFVIELDSLVGLLVTTEVYIVTLFEVAAFVFDHRH